MLNKRLYNKCLKMEQWSQENTLPSIVVSLQQILTELKKLNKTQEKLYELMSIK